MEALIANLLEPGETIIVGNNGALVRQMVVDAVATTTLDTTRLPSKC